MHTLASKAVTSTLKLHGTAIPPDVSEAKTQKLTSTELFSKKSFMSKNKTRRPLGSLVMLALVKTLEDVRVKPTELKSMVWKPFSSFSPMMVRGTFSMLEFNTTCLSSTEVGQPVKCGGILPLPLPLPFPLPLPLLKKKTFNPSVKRHNNVMDNCTGTRYGCRLHDIDF